MDVEQRPGPAAPLPRRFLAAAIDALVLGLVGIALALAFGEHLGGPGSPSRLVGLPFAVAYLGLAGSRLGGGQTAGKAFTRLKVVGHDGRPLGLPRALLRALVLSTPWFFNGLQFTPGTPLVRAWFALGGLLVFGVVPASLLLGLASPGRRQFLHELAAGSFVVDEDQDAVPARWIPRWVVGVASVWIAAIAVLSFILAPKVPEASAEDPLQAALLDVRGLSRFAITHLHVVQNGQSFQVLRVVVATRRGGDEGETIVRNAAAAVVAFYPQLNQFSAIQVQSVSGVDVGLASWSTGNTETRSPEEWRAALGAEVNELLQHPPSLRGK